jgi:hypothetical protein
MTKHPPPYRSLGPPPLPPPPPSLLPRWAEIPLCRQRQVLTVVCEMALAHLRPRSAAAEVSDEPGPR